ncbi:TPA: alanine racemase, partial [Clostridioides difficile]|nr:alanine racemase [Clostridioides difficile]
SKHGLDREEVVDFVKEVSEKYKNIKIKGLMTMAPFIEDEDEIRGVFKGLKDLSKQIKELNIPNVGMDVLSMGMSHDYEIAIEEGATIVRVGTSIFGERNYNKK